MNSIFKNHLEIRKIMSPSKVSEIQLKMIQSKKFYEVLAKLGCKRSAKDSANLSNFLRLNVESKDQFLLKKLL